MFGEILKMVLGFFDGKVLGGEGVGGRGGWCVCCRGL